MFRIAICDDEKIFRDDLKEILIRYMTDRGIMLEIDTFSSGKEFVELGIEMVKYKIEPKRMQLVYPFVDKEPNMVLIEGYRDGKSRLTVEKPLVVYQEPNVYTDEILEIYGKK